MPDIPQQIVDKSMDSSSEGGPMASPFPSPQDAKGSKAKAQVSLNIARNMIEQALMQFEANDEEYPKILKALNILTPLSSKQDSDNLIPSEVMALVGNLPQVGGGSDTQRQLMQQILQSGQAQKAPPGQPAAPQLPQQTPQGMGG